MYSDFKQSIDEANTINELPLTGNSNYAEIQKVFVKSTNISVMMVLNTFAKKWIQMVKLINFISYNICKKLRNYSSFHHFFESDKTLIITLPLQKQKNRIKD